MLAGGAVSRAALAAAVRTLGERMSEKELRVLLHVLHTKGALPTPTPASAGAAALRASSAAHASGGGKKTGGAAAGRPGLFGGRGRAGGANAGAVAAAMANSVHGGLNPLTSPLSAYLPETVTGSDMRGRVLGLGDEAAAAAARDLGYTGAVWTD